MRLALLFFLATCVVLRAGTGMDKLNLLGGLWHLQPDGRTVEILPYTDDRIWVNASRVDTHDEQSYQVRGGDRVDVWEEDKCWRFYFEVINPSGITVTIWTYASESEDIGQNRTRLKSGRLLRREVLHATTAQFPDMIWEDINCLEMGHPGIYRSK